jgi:DNA processing protein
MDERTACVALNVFPGIGPVRFRILHKRFGGALGFWNATDSLIQSCGLPAHLVSQFLIFRRKFRVSQYVEILRLKGITFLTLDDPLYPRLLKYLPDAPFVLYVRGNMALVRQLSDMPSLAVVGTRKMTEYGKEITGKLTVSLCTNGFIVVSGMAYGVDAVAHASALSVGGKTIAVLGCGVDVIAPSGNEHLYNEIIESGDGLILSEMPLGLRPGKGLFPVRNRIISGLSHGVLVTEGDETSGALITARYAAEQGREVFAVPGQVNRSSSRGPSYLIKQGAKLVENISDILDELSFPIFTRHPDDEGISRKELTGDEQAVAELLKDGQRRIDDIIRELSIPSQRVISALTVLEVHGIVKSCGDTMYELIL